MTSKYLKIFKFEFDLHDYVPVQVFISIHSAGASPQIGEILRFSWLYCIYSRARAQVEAVDGVSPFMAHTMCSYPRTVLLGVATIPEFIWGQYLPKWGVNRQFQAKPAENMFI